jgi:hypothetical protein
MSQPDDGDFLVAHGAPQRERSPLLVMAAIWDGRAAVNQFKYVNGAV